MKIERSLLRSRSPESIITPFRNHLKMVWNQAQDLLRILKVNPRYVFTPSDMSKFISELKKIYEEEKDLKNPSKYLKTIKQILEIDARLNKDKNVSRG
ncbi:hypothetical protein [uncultured Methanobacterium sp.]|uniref:hypothetical protein n=1 Tax=uncultured Methanobacterium sp. TaxID=176306 RepID=UPI002AA6E993|nr:hypothetical protein [uncultured Methanobacterium sp.]